MSFEIQRSLNWMAKALGRSLGPSSGGEVPQAVDDGIKATINALGWERYLVEETSERSAGAPAAEIESLVVPEGEAWFVVNADASHSDAATRYLMLTKIYQRFTPVVEIAVSCDAKSVGSGERVVLFTPVLLLPGDFMRARSAVALVAGTINLRIGFLRIAPGEYIPPL